MLNSVKPILSLQINTLLYLQDDLMNNDHCGITQNVKFYQRYIMLLKYWFLFYRDYIKFQITLGTVNEQTNPYVLGMSQWPALKKFIN
jgi:hypothetical protein